MLNPKIGDTLLRITPPRDDRDCEGECQSGVVTQVTDDMIEVLIQVDIPRYMLFSRDNGRDMLGLGTYVVRPDRLILSEHADGFAMQAIASEGLTAGQSTVEVSITGPGDGLFKTTFELADDQVAWVSVPLKLVGNKVGIG